MVFTPNLTPARLLRRACEELSVPYHAWTHRPKADGGTDPLDIEAGGVSPYHIKVFGDTQQCTTGDKKFAFAIDEDLDGTTLTKVELYVTVVSSSGIVQVQLRNSTDAVDMLSTRVQVDAGEKH